MRRRVLGMAACVLWLASCASGSPTATPGGGGAGLREAREAADLLDEIAEDIDEYGIISASTPAILLSPADHFTFELDELTPQKIFEYERREATSRVSDQLAVGVRGAVRLVPPAPAAPPAGAGAGEPGPAQAQGGDAAPLATPDNQSLQVLESDRFSASLAAADPGSLRLNLRELIRLTADDHMTLKLLEWLSDPDPKSLGQNWLVYAFVLNVSLRPGHRTYSGYIGEIDLWVEYGAEVGAEILRGKDALPLTFAVFPGVDAQVIDERSSFRRQLALALAAQGQWQQVEAALESDLARRLEHDLATVTSLNTVAGYNMSGRHVGWRFSPRIVAQTDASDPGTGGGQRLLPQTFPALILVLAEKGQIAKPLGGTNQDAPACLEDEDGVRTGFASPAYDHLLVHYSTRWLRAPDPQADDSFWPWARAWSLHTRPRPTEGDAIEWGVKLDEALGLLGQARAKGASPYVTHPLANRFNFLEAASIGADLEIALPRPPEAPFALKAVSPRQGWSNRESWFVLHGKGLDNLDVVIVGGVKAKSVTANQKGTAAIIHVADGFSGGAVGQVDVTAVHETAGAVTLPDAVTFSLAPPQPDTTKSRVDVQWVPDGQGKLVPGTIVTRGDATAADVLEAIQKPPGEKPSGSGSGKKGDADGGKKP